jgi:beta-lactamase regulating signal transducer with metallopeptidase domain
MMLELLNPVIIETLGWTLLHFLWQGLLIHLLLLLTLYLLRQHSANTRYVAAYTALLLMLFLPAGTAAWLWRDAPATPTSVELVVEPHHLEPGAVSMPASNSDVTAASTTSPATAAPTSAQRSIPVFRLPVQQALPWLVLAWFIGTLILSLRLLGGWLLTRQLRTRQTHPAPQELQHALARLKRQLGGTRSVTLFVSTASHVPILIGWLKPVILIPASAITGLTTRQLEMILAHELAHVHRHDYLANIVQTLAEMLFFYHPSTWWVSGKVREEREHCCDALAVHLCGGNTIEYANTLVRLEHIRRQPQLALAMTGGHLLGRIRHLLGHANPQQPHPLQWFTGLFILSLLTLASLLILTPQVTQAQDAPPSAAGPVTVWTNVKGFPTLREGDTPLERLGGNYSIIIQEQGPSGTRTVHLTETPSKSIREYHVNGQAAEFDAEATAWLNRVLEETFIPHYPDFARGNRVFGRTSEGAHYALYLQRNPGLVADARHFIDVIAPGEFAALATQGEPLAGHIALTHLAVEISSREASPWWYQRDAAIRAYAETALSHHLSSDALSLLKGLVEEIEDAAQREALLSEVASATP